MARRNTEMDGRGYSGLGNSSVRFPLVWHKALGVVGQIALYKSPGLSRWGQAFILKRERNNSLGDPRQSREIIIGSLPLSDSFDLFSALAIK
jgi:hypothetical protein